MIMSVAAVLGGFVVLVWGAERFVAGASASARNLGVSPLLIGLTIVGFGTSAPEMLISAIAAWDGNPGLAIGNALGSNITNVGLVIGVTALITPLTVRSSTVRRELPLLLVVMLAALAIMADGNLGRGDGWLLLAGMVIMVVLVVLIGIRSRSDDTLSTEFEEALGEKRLSLAAGLSWMLVGLLVLLVSSRILVWGAVNIATALGVSDLVIGLTIVAIGTSLPELAASVSSALKGEHDIAIGNVIGSNMFNLLGVLGLPGAISPGTFAPEVLSRDFPVMIALTLALLVMAWGFRGAGRVNRVEGAVLLAAFLAYQFWLYWNVMVA